MFSGCPLSLLSTYAPYIEPYNLVAWDARLVSKAGGSRAPNTSILSHVICNQGHQSVSPSGSSVIVDYRFLLAVSHLECPNHGFIWLNHCISNIVYIDGKKLQFNRIVL